jgi:Na+/H+-translocating membrane pyrophosphatase
VGDNVGDIAGMGADLFGSFAESTCAALVVSSGGCLASHTGVPHQAFLAAVLAAASPVGIISPRR